MSRHPVRGVHYNVEIKGSGQAIFFLHGFTGSTATWQGVLGRLPEHFRSVRVDLPGHGKSDAPPDPARYAMSECALDLAELIDKLGLGRVHLVGYSMGGRLALHMALAAPELLASLVLVSASPGIADPEEREARKRSDARLAQSILTEGLPAFVDRWENVPLFATEKRLPRVLQEDVRRERLAQRPLGLANSLLGAGAGCQEYLMDALAKVQVPALLVAGELDAKYVALARSMAERMSGARVHIVPDAGHAVHRERPEQFADLLCQHLQCVEGKTE